MLAPFGDGNREPQFLVQGELCDVSVMGRDGAHLSAALRDGPVRLRLVGFRQGARRQTLKMLSRAEALVTLRLNTYRDVTSVNGFLGRVRAIVPERLRQAAKAFLQSPGEASAARVAWASTERPDENAIRRAFIRIRPFLRNGFSIDDADEETLLALLVLTEAGVTAAAGELFFEQVVTEKKQITNGALFTALRR